MNTDTYVVSKVNDYLMAFEAEAAEAANLMLTMVKGWERSTDTFSAHQKDKP